IGVLKVFYRTARHSWQPVDFRTPPLTELPILDQLRSKHSKNTGAVVLFSGGNTAFDNYGVSGSQLPNLVDLFRTFSLAELFRINNRSQEFRQGSGGFYSLLCNQQPGVRR